MHIARDVKGIPMSEAQQRLLNAAAHLQMFGWCQRKAHIGTKSCLIGALAITGGLLFTTHDHSAVEEVWGRIVAMIGEDFVEWNDSPDRTADEVIEMLMRAAELETNYAVF